MEFIYANSEGGFNESYLMVLRIHGRSGYFWDDF